MATNSVRLTFRRRSVETSPDAPALAVLRGLGVPPRFQFRGRAFCLDDVKAHTLGELGIREDTELHEAPATFELVVSDGSVIRQQLHPTASAKAVRQVVRFRTGFHCRLFLLDGTEWKSTLNGARAFRFPPLIRAQLLPTIVKALVDNELTTLAVRPTDTVSLVLRGLNCKYSRRVGPLLDESGRALASHAQFKNFESNVIVLKERSN